MQVEELEGDRLYQSVCSDITNLYEYMYRGGHGRKWCETKHKPGTECEYGIWEVSQSIN
jgi:hypothetical protein